MIKEVIVVEGRHDTINLKQYFDCETIETHGTCLSDFTLSLIKKAKEERGVIIFCDPDSPGEKIRSIINQKIPGCKNAFLQADECRDKRKVGIEHASKEVLEKALSQLITYNDNKGQLSMNDFYELGLSGKDNSAMLRDKLQRYYRLGKANAKTLLKRCNMLDLSIDDIRKVILDESDS
ncbi:MAG: ribonuclease M5 [Firmicutes bacterium]|nr:ribonuclease M5 [Erysipelotrichaceae bacterium]MDD6525475.1 ribonuclease M5 [Bacillota bacterium]MDD7228217.1 ribonuclease M5 [Bacillota bacterium]MDY5997619.1 ribonuclease M5 [Erysipelotrichaceae bacterium]